MREILGEYAEKLKYSRIINRCTLFAPEKRYSDIMAVSCAIKRSSRPNFVQYITVGTLAVMLVVFRSAETSNLHRRGKHRADR